LLVGETRRGFRSGIGGSKKKRLANMFTSGKKKRENGNKEKVGRILAGKGRGGFGGTVKENTKGRKKRFWSRHCECRPY